MKHKNEKKTMRKSYLLMLVVLGLFSCQTSEIGRRLRVTEHRMEECPFVAYRELSSLSSDTIRMNAPEYARYCILAAETVYRRHQQLDTYHLAVAGRYYSRARFYGLCRGRAVYRLLASVWHYEKGDYLSSLQGLLSSVDSVERLSDPYLTGVLHYYLGRIYLRHRLYSRALESFRRERLSVIRTGDVCQLAKSDHHFALGFCAAGSLDSCRAYLSHSLSCLPRLDSLGRRMVLHNVQLLQEACFPDLDLSADDGQIPVGASTPSRPRDRKRSAGLRVPDLRENFAGRPRVGGLSYLWRYRLCRDRGEYRSALRHYEHYHRFKSEYLSRLRTAEVVEVLKTHEETVRERRIRRLYGSVFVSVSVSIAYLLALYRGSRQRDRRLYGSVFVSASVSIANLLVLYRRSLQRNLRLSWALDVMRRSAGKQADQVSSLRRDVAAGTVESEKLRHCMEKTAQTLRRERMQLSTYRDLVVRLMYRFMLKKEGTPLCGRDFSLLVEEYAGHSAAGASLVRRLRSLPVRLSDRDVFICILLHEHGDRGEDLATAIGAANRNAFKSAKSKLKARLQVVRGRDEEVDRLLDRFGRVTF